MSKILGEIQFLRAPLGHHRFSHRDYQIKQNRTTGLYYGDPSGHHRRAQTKPNHTISALALSRKPKSRVIAASLTLILPENDDWLCRSRSVHHDHVPQGGAGFPET